MITHIYKTECSIFDYFKFCIVHSNFVNKVYKVCRRMSNSIRLPRGRHDDYIIMPSKYDSLEFKAINSFVSSQTFNLVPHFGSMNKMFSKRQLCNDWRRRENRSRQIIFT